MATSKKCEVVHIKQNAIRTRDPDMECGIRSCRPKALRCFTNMLTFSLVYSLSGLFTSTLSTYISSQITTLEKYFGFNSSQTGFLLSCNDIGFLVATLFVSYFARRVHIPRVLAITTVLFGISGIFCSLAYFLKPMSEQRSFSDPDTNSTHAYNHRFQEAQMCDIMSNQNNSTLYECLDTKKEVVKMGIPTEFTPVAMTIIAIGMIVQGIAKSPRQPFVTTYVDDNVEKTKTPLYMGIILAIAAFGSTIAFAIGGIFSRIYVTLKGPTHPHWIGAWWLGFLFFGGVSLVPAIPLIFFPRRLHRISETKIEQNKSTKTDTVTAIKAWFKSIIRLLTNRLYVLSVLNKCLLMFVISGYLSFLPKYMGTQFTIPAWKANLLMGALTVVATSASAFVGGVVAYRCKLTPIGCVKFMLACNVLSFVVSLLGFIIGCPDPTIVGYNTVSHSSNSKACSKECSCDDTDFFPVCGSDDQTYFSPCHAGCSYQTNQSYMNCTCIFTSGTAAPGICNTGCSMLYPYVTAVLIAGSVPDEDKSMAVGLTSFLQTVLGWLPGPVVMGILIDTTCELWRSSCADIGACAIYNNADFRIKRHTLESTFKFGNIVVILLAYLLSMNKTDWSTDTSYKITESEAHEMEANDSVVHL